ncbi:hypothetical protein HPP92_025045 [Vanilla planifolia]|uniref:DDT domain-containing protein n=1 Tax=Vanilla planifolia TaxID=51239 RepID=A0A835PH52_VANPL|nr:hypothetical protein HPP92_025045 [Vanilla planifolia]
MVHLSEWSLILFLEMPFGLVADTRKSHCDEGTQRALKRKKVLKSSDPESQRLLESNSSVKKYGMGKALMTVWHATNSRHGKFPNGKNLIDGLPFTSSNEVLRQKQDRIKKKMPKKTPRRRKAPENIDANHKSSRHIECGLLVDEVDNLHQSTLFTPLVDDEDLELRELEPASTSLKCSSHLGLSGQHGCPLCKDLLARFPPRIVKMKQPIAAKPWDSSPELVKKLFVVFRFLYSFACSFEMCTFTLDELAQAFIDKDSLLLGKIHVGLLKLLLLGVESEIATGFISTGSRDCRFLSFLHFVREQEFDVSIWTECLNSLSWTEIFAASIDCSRVWFKQNSVRRYSFNKERSRMAKYGLCPRTLKGELFSILLKEGSLGSKVSELAKAPQIVTLDMPGSQKEQEELICSTLSSDITLFEKIGPMAYRLRVNPQIKGNYGSQSDDDLGGVEDESSDADTSRCSDDSEGENSVLYKQKIVKYKSKDKGSRQKLIEHNEIDESYPGEAWFLGLMEGDYSNLSTEEKLDTLVALVDLVGASSSIRTAEPSVALSTSATSMPSRGSGAKIKRLPCLSKSTSSNIRKESGIEKTLSVGDCFQSDSLLAFSNATKKGQSSGGTETASPDVHPPKSIYLGSDRRYNNYWLFLGSCEKSDPGHRRYTLSHQKMATGM